MADEQALSDDAVGKRAPASVGVVELGLGDATKDEESNDEKLVLVSHARNRTPKCACQKS